MTTIEVDEDEHGSWTLFRVRGELDLVTSPRIRRRVHDVVAGGRHDLVLDLSAVRFCDSSGVGMLIAARRLLRSCGGRLRLVLPEDREGHVGRVLAALGVRRLFEVYEDGDAALTGTDPLPVDAPLTGPGTDEADTGAVSVTRADLIATDRIAPSTGT